MCVCVCGVCMDARVYTSGVTGCLMIVIINEIVIIKDYHDTWRVCDRD